MTTLAYDILGWKAWSASDSDSQPDVSVIPAMLRRRLSQVGRAALSVIIPMIETHGAMPLVFVSRHGDFSRTFGLLEELAKAEPLSPTAFSLSVHNAIAGLFSVHQGLKSNITALSGGSQDVVAALLESLGQCQASQGPVLCVFCDAPLPEVYHDYTHLPERAYALALVVAPGNGWHLALADTSAANTEPAEPVQALRLLAQLEDAQLATQFFASNGARWSLARAASVSASNAV